MLDVQGLSCGYGGKPVLSDISFVLKKSQVLCLLGPNGSGKTTLFKTLLGLQPAIAGSISFEKEELSKWTPRQRARTIGYIPQATQGAVPFSVRDMVVMGRSPHISTFSSPDAKDWEVAEKAMHQIRISHLAHKPFNRISGGERQMVLIARALAQEPRLLVMDEPTASLDFANQHLVMQEVSRLAETGMAIVMSSHHPSHAFLHASHVMLIRRDGVEGYGVPEDVLTEEKLEKAYGISVRVAQVKGPGEQRMGVCIPVAEGRR